MTAQRVCKWPQKRITYYENMTFPKMTREEIKKAYDQAFQQWAEVADLEPVRVESPTGANIVVSQGRIDWKWGVLAWSQLPCGASANTTLTQKYDTSEDWNYNFLVATACHELGHALGLNHLGRGTLMAPTLNMNITKPQPGDIAEIQARYGKPNVNPPKPPDPPDPPKPPQPGDKLTVGGSVKATFKNSGQVFHYPLNVPNKSKVVIETETDLDAFLAIRQDGKFLSVDDDSGKGLNSRIEMELQGDYVVTISSKGGIGEVIVRATAV